MILLWCILDMFVISLQGTCEFFIWSHITVFLNHLNLYIVWHLKWTCAAIVFLHLLSSASVLCRFCICQLYYLHRVQLPNVDDLDWNVVWVHHHHSLYQLLCASLCPEAKKLKNRKLTHWQGKWLLYNINVFLFFLSLLFPLSCATTPMSTISDWIWCCVEPATDWNRSGATWRIFPWDLLWYFLLQKCFALI